MLPEAPLLSILVVDCCPLQRSPHLKIHLAVRYYLAQPELGAVLLAGRVCRYNRLFLFQNILHSSLTNYWFRTRTSIAQRVSSGWNSIRVQEWDFFLKSSWQWTPKKSATNTSFRLPMIAWFIIKLVISKGFWIQQVDGFSCSPLFQQDVCTATRNWQEPDCWLVSIDHSEPTS